MRAYTLEEVVSRDLKVEWVWGSRIPRGYVTLLGAKGGTGKSGFALWLADQLAGEGKKILYVDAENTLKHMAERTDNWNLKHKNSLLVIADEDEYCSLESCFPGFAQTSTIARDNAVELIIIDSLTAVSTGRNLKDERDAVLLMKELRDLARIVNGAVLLLCHIKKPISPGDYVITADEIAGSHAIVDMARSVLLMTSDERDKSLKRIRHGKYNFSAPAPDLVFNLDESGIYNIHEEYQDNNLCLIESGSKAEKYQHIALELARAQKNKRDIRKAVKDLGASEVEASRAIQWLREKHNFVFT